MPFLSGWAALFDGGIDKQQSTSAPHCVSCRTPAASSSSQRKQPTSSYSRECQEEKRDVGSKTGAESCQDVSHHHGRLCRLLAALLCVRPPHAPFPSLGLWQLDAECLPLAWLLQLYAQPYHLHHFQPRIPTGIQATFMRQGCRSNFCLPA